VASTVWKGQLSFGLVSFAVRLTKAARKERIPLRYVREQSRVEPAEEHIPSSVAISGFHRDDGEEEHDSRTTDTATEAVVSPVRQMYVTPDETQPVLTDQLQRGYEVTPGRFAVVRSEELRRLRQPTSTEMQILRSVRMEEIDPVFLETSYYVHPGPGADHSYGLFFRALKESSYAALAEVAMHGRQHVIVIRAGTTGLIAHTMFYVNEVRKGEEHVTIATDVPAKELDLAKQFVEAIAASFKPEEFTDRYREQLGSLIAAKETAGSRSVEVEAALASAKIVDIMDALRKSLERAEAKATTRKPVSRVIEGRKPRKRHA